ncbi:hypothetical protein OROGR_023333 [Orobanche gracilis]
MGYRFTFIRTFEGAGGHLKLKALTHLYEQQKQTSASIRISQSKPQVKAVEQNVMRENTISHLTNSTVTRTFVLPEPPSEDAKENFAVGADKIVGFSSARKPAKVMSSNIAARKLSTENVEKQGKVIGGESRILVFVRVRPMNKKEKEAGSRSCVKIANRRDVYLSEFANENDYLRLNRIRGRHFTFDASFPDSATQQEVYLTT